MADKTFLDEVDQIDLGLDVSLNEFEDEFQRDTQEKIKSSPNKSNKTLNPSSCGENLKERCVVGGDSSELSGEGLLESEHCTKDGKLSKDDGVEEGEVLSQEEEMQLLMDDTENDDIEDGRNIPLVNQSRENLKRKVDNSDAVLDEEVGMDVDESMLLESDEESMLQGKKCKKEEDGEVPQDEPMKRKTRGGKKKKKKKHRPAPVHYGRMPQPIIGRLFRPLLATENDAPQVLAGQLADRLEEEKEDLILRVLRTIGNKKSIEIFQETKKIQVEGGMSTVYGNRRRTSGGIFFHLLKSKGYATKEQLKEIFAAEREKLKQLIKEQKQRDKELRERGIHDLRQKLAEKKEMLMKTENVESENGSLLEASTTEGFFRDQK